ncbi:hypothetical protein AOXY_G27912 [Acipenser oxyrinchus oxyrinchus]|uniref:Uncharacterized protein n=1 Tax=Acipenser oxyrinchus oxyrinchus TaxID=40147 RepID=A0AAD8CNH0_ACIOX|nr:hypothetical protein AOXY_G27912 [Acipenser oxyrinchus oxyrinchus]
MSPSARRCLLCLLLLSDQLYCHPLKIPPVDSHSGSSNGFPIGLDGQNIESASDYQDVPTSDANQEETESYERLLDNVFQDPHLKMIRNNITCNDLIGTAMLDEIVSLPFARDFTDVALAFVLGQLGCTEEIKPFVFQLIDDLGITGNEHILLQIKELIEQSDTNSPVRKENADISHVNAIIFNINQITVQAQNLIEMESNSDNTSSVKISDTCQVLVQINESSLNGPVLKSHKVLFNATSMCEDLGHTCAGVRLSINGTFEVIERKDNFLLPQRSSVSWIHECAELQFEKGHFISKRHAGCSDENEEKAYNVIQWIPILSSFYSLGTSIYYAAKDCPDVAKERAIDIAIDLGTDIAVALTGGAASAAVYGAKTGIKLGAKAGLKAGIQGVKAGVTSAVKTASKKVVETVTTKISKEIIKDAGKQGISKLSSLAKQIKTIPTVVKQTSGQIKKQTSILASKIGSDGVLKSSKDLVVTSSKKAKEAVKEGLDSLADKARRNIEEVYGSKKTIEIKNPKTKAETTFHCIVKRMAGNNCKRKRPASPDNNHPSSSNTDGNIGDGQRHTKASNNNQGFSTNSDRNIEDVFNTRNSAQWRRARQEELKQWSVYTPTTQNVGHLKINEDAFKNLPPKRYFGALTQINDMYPNTRTVIEFPLAGETRRVIARPAPHGKNQIYIQTLNADYPGTKSPGTTYQSVIKQLTEGKLDDKDIAKMILESLDLSLEKQQHIWDKLSKNQQRAAVDFIAITQIAESVPPINPNIKSGRVPGMDKNARSHLREIQEGKKTFKAAFASDDPDFVPSKRGGLQIGRDFANRQNNKADEAYRRRFPGFSDYETH